MISKYRCRSLSVVWVKTNSMIFHTHGEFEQGIDPFVKFTGARVERVRHPQI